VEGYTRQHYPAVSVLTAVREVVRPGAQVRYAQGCALLGTDASLIPEAVAAARDAQVAILALGGRGAWMHAGSEGEGVDSANLDLPGVQQQLLEAVAGTGTPIVLVLFGGRPYTISWAAEHVPAILAVFYPGQEGGRAIAAALFGDTNPAGRLPYSIPRHVGQVPIYHSQRQGSGYHRSPDDFFRGYADMPATPLYPFGHGLSYTTFEYSDLEISPTQPDADGTVEVSCRVRNSGDLAGEEVVQLYLRDVLGSVVRPVQQLAGFARLRLAAGASCRVTFRVPMHLLAFLDGSMRLIVEPGATDVQVGASSEDIRLHGAFEIVGEERVLPFRTDFCSQVTITG